MLFLSSTGCNETKNEDNSNKKNEVVLEEIDSSFPHFQMMDKPGELKGKTLKGVFIYDGFEGETYKDIGEGLKNFLEKSNEGIYGKFYRYSSNDVGNYRLNVVLFIPKNIDVPNVSYGDSNLIIEFMCEEGNPSKGNRVISIERGRNN